jgi:hypothetical protein
MHFQYRKKNHLTGDGNQEEFLERGIPLLGYIHDWGTRHEYTENINVVV